MSYPVDQLAALGRANFNLALKLADVARVSGQDSLQAGNKAISGFAEDARSAVVRATGKGESAPATPSDKTVAVLSDAEKIRDHAIATTKAAFEEWQLAVKDLVSFPTGTTATDAFGGLFKPWFGAITAATPAAADTKPTRG